MKFLTAQMKNLPKIELVDFRRLARFRGFGQGCRVC